MTIVMVVLSLLCIFELVCVPAAFGHISLNAVVCIYLTVSAVFLTVQAVYRKRRGQSAAAETLKRAEADSRAADVSEKERADISRLKILCFLLFVVQLLLVTAYRHTDDDDAWYLGTAAAAYETGKIYAYSPYTGEKMALADAKDYVLSPLPVFWAAVAKIIHIHPTILSHTVMPGGLLIFAYYVYWLLANRLFRKEKGTFAVWVFFLLINILNLFGFYSTRTSGTFLLFRSWQGKAVFCAILVPLLFYYFLGLLSLPVKSRKKDGFCDLYREKQELAGIYLTMGAGCLTSFSAVTLMPLLLLAMALTLAIAKRSLRIPLKMSFSLIPNALLIFLYLFAM